MICVTYRQENCSYPSRWVRVMAERNQAVLVRAIEKLAWAGEQAGFSVEEMINLLDTGVSVETLLNLVCQGLSSNLAKERVQ